MKEIFQVNNKLECYVGKHRKEEAIGSICPTKMAVTQEVTKIHSAEEAHLPQDWVSQPC